MLKLTGASPMGLSSLEHRGRTSGARYRTPLAAAKTRHGFLFAMPYGEGSDWAQNLAAAGDGVVEYKGTRYRLARPRVIPATEALSRLPIAFRTFSRLVGIEKFMELDAQPLAEEGEDTRGSGPVTVSAG